MNMQVRRFNNAGIDTFENWLAAKDGSPPPLGILEDEQYSEPLSLDLSIDTSRDFETTFEIGQYLVSIFKDVDATLIFRDSAMWAWLSLALITNIVSRRGGGKAGAPLASDHYVQRSSNKSRHGYRLILRSAWWAVRLHGKGAKIVLGSKESPWGELAEQILGRSQLSSHPIFFEVAKDLYLDESGTMKRGAAGKRDKNARKNPKARAGLGAVRRLAMTINQFGKTYNTRAISAHQMIALLPKEYTRFSSM